MYPTEKFMGQKLWLINQNNDVPQVNQGNESYNKEYTVQKQTYACVKKGCSKLCPNVAFQKITSYFVVPSFILEVIALQSHVWCHVDLSERIHILVQPKINSLSSTNHCSMSMWHTF